MFPYVKKKTNKPISIKEHYLRRNKVLIKRRYGGYGDIIMQRMMFQDFHIAMPEIDLTYSCPRKYFDFAKNHPYAKCIEIEDLQEREYGAIYDISTACRVYESRMGAKNKKNRSDIWANHCGIELKNHECFLKCPDEDFYKEQLYQINKDKKPMVLFAAKSTRCEFGVSKSLTDNQIYEISKYLLDHGFFVFTIHDEPIEPFNVLNIPQFLKLEPDSWLNLVAASDYVISIDTGTFHIAGALKKPLVGVFSFTDGKIYGKYYDFVLVQKHRDNGDWDCGPCYICTICPKEKKYPKPCMTELTPQNIIDGFMEVQRRLNK